MRNKRIKKAVNEVISLSHAELDLASSTHAVMPWQRQAWKTLNQVQGDLMITTASGFTLIELLVVVLIIGILASVALPQYNKAVMKARATEIQTFLNAVEKAMDFYVMENGYPNNTKPISWADLALDTSPYCTGGIDNQNHCLAKYWKAYAQGDFNRYDFQVWSNENYFGDFFIMVEKNQNGSVRKTCTFDDKAKPLCEMLKAVDSQWEISLES